MKYALVILLLALCSCGDETQPSQPIALSFDAARGPARIDLGAVLPAVDTGAPTPDATLQQRDAKVTDAHLSADAQIDAAPDAVVDAAVDPNASVRFVVLGDTGKGNDGQRIVAEALVDACDALGGCQFALLLGDIIYDAGVVSVDDPQWQTKFEEPYANVNMPFYATLGNHDYGAPAILEDFAGGIGIDPTRGQAQIDYAATQDKFRLPASFYRFKSGPVELVSLNTASMFWRDLTFIEDITGFALINDEQEERLPEWQDNPLATWRIAFGHHPYLSNGRHGNAGQYDFVFIPGLPGSGTALKEFMDTYVIGQFDAYLAGHDHNLQDLGDEDGTQLLVSGAGASARDLRPINPSIYESSALGFIIIEATEQELNFRFIEVNEGADAQRLWVEVHTRSVRQGQ